MINENKNRDITTLMHVVFFEDKIPLGNNVASLFVPFSCLLMLHCRIDIEIAESHCHMNRLSNTLTFTLPLQVTLHILSCLISNSLAKT